MNREQHRAWRRYVFGCPELTQGQRLVLLALETFADFPAGTNARPGVCQLAEICGMGTRVVEYALARGRDLGLIKQTSRANPKRGQVSTYRMLPAPIEPAPPSGQNAAPARTSVRAEPLFKPHSDAGKTDFNPHESVVSTRTSVHPTNKEHQVNTPVVTKAAPLRNHTRARNTPRLDSFDAEAATPAAELVKQTIPNTIPAPIRAMLRIRAGELLQTGTEPAIVLEALRLWQDKPDAGPGLLASLAAQAVKSRAGPGGAHPPNGVGPPTEKALGYRQLGHELINELHGSSST